MEGRKMGRIGRIAYAGLAMALISTPAFAQEGGGLDLIEMFEQMGAVAMAIAVVLFVMSFWSVGVAIERIYTFAQAKKQSKLYAPQVAKHLKEGRLKEAIALSSAKEYRYSHLAKVVLAGLQEYQFQQESGSNLSREDILDTVRRSIQRATALTSNDLKKGVSGLATIGATAPFVGLLGTVVGVINAFVGIASTGSGGRGPSTRSVTTVCDGTPPFPSVTPLEKRSAPAGQEESGRGALCAQGRVVHARAFLKPGLRRSRLRRCRAATRRPETPGGSGRCCLHRSGT